MVPGRDTDTVGPGGNQPGTGDFPTNPNPNPNPNPNLPGPGGEGPFNPNLPGQGGVDQSNTGVNGRPHVNKGCGYRNVNGVGFRITGNLNNEANFAEFPWMVAVLRQDVVQGNKVKVYQCGGSLIHKRVVLTAAHCVYG